MPDPGLAALIAALSHPSAYPEADWEGVPPSERRVERIQTHISAVFLTPRHAYKLKKPLRLWGLLDYGTPERRLHWCRDEVRLNRRLAPDLYLGVAPLLPAAGGGVRVGPVGEERPGGEHVVVMRRFDARDTLRQRLSEGRAGAADLAGLGERIGRFHRAGPLAPAAPPAAAAARSFAAVLHNNVRATRGFVPSLFPPAVHRHLEHHLALALLRRRPALRQRIAAGRVVDGHGDLRLEHVLLEENRPIQIIDCVEFNPALRQVDAASDLAFLVMELQATGHAELIPVLLEGYSEPVEPAVLGLFCAYRAHVRAKVEAATSVETDVPASQRAASERSARSHLSLALAWARQQQTPPALVLMRGTSGSGKSHLAARLAPWMLADRHRSDWIRKRLHGLDPLLRPQAPDRDRLYGAEANRRTEAALLEAARISLAAGRNVLLDATHLRASSRRHAAELAMELGAPWLILDLRTSQATVEQRLRRRAARNDDPSDADLDVQRQQLRYSEPLSAEEDGRTVPVDEAAAEDPSQVLMAIWDLLALSPPPGR
jgi:aminoglycoside phosphotransferase family enzyme/predicted kinase